MRYGFADAFFITHNANGTDEPLTDDTATTWSNFREKNCRGKCDRAFLYQAHRFAANLDLVYTIRTTGQAKVHSHICNGSDRLSPFDTAFIYFSPFFLCQLYWLAESSLGSRQQRRQQHQRRATDPNWIGYDCVRVETQIERKKTKLKSFSTQRTAADYNLFKCCGQRDTKRGACLARIQSELFQWKRRLVLSHAPRSYVLWPVIILMLNFYSNDSISSTVFAC